MTSSPPQRVRRLGGRALVVCDQPPERLTGSANATCSPNDTMSTCVPRHRLQRAPARGAPVCPGHRGHAIGWDQRSRLSPTGRESRLTRRADLLRGLKRPDMTAPVLAAGDGALSGSPARSARSSPIQCWVLKMAGVMNALPKSAQPRRPGRARRESSRPVRQGVRGQATQGEGEGHQGPRGTAGVLSLPHRSPPSPRACCGPR